jgi:lysophospholipase L1-like esterase
MNPSFIFVDKTYNRFRPKPHALNYEGFKLNSLGFKDLEFNLNKDPNTFRIVAIGDSFAYGVVPYQYNFFTVLEDNLNQDKPQKKREVYNMGIPKIGPVDYFSLLINEGLRYKPDMVILSFFMGNDFSDDRNFYAQAGMQWYSYSYVTSLIKFMIDLAVKYKGNPYDVAKKDNMKYDDNMTVFADETYLNIEKDRSYIFPNPPSQQFTQDFDDAFSYLMKIKEICESRKIKFLVVLIPDEMQVNLALQAKVVKAIQKTPQEVDFTLPNKLLAQKFQQNNIDYLDVLPVFAEASTKKRLYRRNDTHWNIAGNKLAAELIQKHITNQLPK